MKAMAGNAETEQSPPELSDLAERIEALSPSLRVIAFRRPGWQKQTKTPLLLGGYSVEGKDTETGATYIVTTDKLFEAGLAALDEAQGRLLRSTRGRVIATVVFMVGFFVLITPVTFPIGLLLALALMIAGVAL